VSNIFRVKELKHDRVPGNRCEPWIRLRSFPHSHVSTVACSRRSSFLPAYFGLGECTPLAHGAKAQTASATTPWKIFKRANLLCPASQVFRAKVNLRDPAQRSQMPSPLAAGCRQNIPILPTPWAYGAPYSRRSA